MLGGGPSDLLPWLDLVVVEGILPLRPNLVHLDWGPSVRPGGDRWLLRVTLPSCRTHTISPRSSYVLPTRFCSPLLLFSFDFSLAACVSGSLSEFWHNCRHDLLKFAINPDRVSHVSVRGQLLDGREAGCPLSHSSLTVYGEPWSG